MSTIEEIVESVVNDASKRAYATVETGNQASYSSYIWCVTYAATLADWILGLHSSEARQAGYDAIVARCHYMDGGNGLLPSLTNALLRHGLERWKAAEHRHLELKKSWRRVKGSAV